MLCTVIVSVLLNSFRKNKVPSLLFFVEQVVELWFISVICSGTISFDWEFLFTPSKCWNDSLPVLRSILNLANLGNWFDCHTSCELEKQYENISIYLYCDKRGQFPYESPCVSGDSSPTLFSLFICSALALGLRNCVLIALVYIKFIMGKYSKCWLSISRW